MSLGLLPNLRNPWYTLMSMELQIVLLSAGIGSRLNMCIPKSMLELETNYKLIDHQLSLIQKEFGDRVKISCVVGYKKELFDTYRSSLDLIENPNYLNTNTAKSLKLALDAVESNLGILWMNGDVYLESTAFDVIREALKRGNSFVGIQYGQKDDEAMKFNTNHDGTLKSLSKELAVGEGEAIGLNFISSRDRPLFSRLLGEADDYEYFEAAIQKVIEIQSFSFSLVDLTHCFIQEIDFKGDLEKSRDRFSAIRKENPQDSEPE